MSEVRDHMNLRHIKRDIISDVISQERLDTQSPRIVYKQ